MGQEALVSHLHHEETSALIYVVAVIIFVVCLSNMLIIYCTLFVRKFKTVINVYLMALAIDDIIIGNICMPLTLLEQMGMITYGPAMCLFLPYLQGFAVAAELWMRVVISLERYHAIVHPILARQWQTIPHALRMITYIWLASGLVCIHILFVSTLQQKKDGGAYQCRQKWPSPLWERAVNVTQFIFFFIIPFCIVALGYMLVSRRIRQRMREDPNSIRLNIKARYQTTNSPRRQESEAGTSGRSLSVQSRADQNTDQTPRPSDSKSGTMRSTHSHSEKSIAAEKKVIWTLSIIVIEFFVCWLPLHLVNLIYLYDTERVSTTNRVLLITQFMGYLSTCFNPIIYFFINANFQEVLRVQWSIIRNYIRRNEAQEVPPSCQTTTTTSFNKERLSCVIHIQRATPTPSERSSVSPVVTPTLSARGINLEVSQQMRAPTPSLD